MALNRDQVERLLSMIQKTRDEEMTCPECLDELGWYVQSGFDGTPIEGTLARVREHLEACRCCSTQFNLVLETLKALED